MSIANAAPPSARRTPLILGSVMLAGLAAPLNSTMITVALPAITRSFSLPESAGSWLVTVYLITMASLLPVSGKLGDRFGHRGVLLAGLVLFLLGSAAAIVAPSFAVLVSCRVMQAVGGSVLTPSSIAILRTAVPEQRLGTALGVVGFAAPLSAAAGPPIGSLILAVAGWRTMFAINLPLVIIPLAIGILVLPRHARPTVSGRFDLGGAVLACVLLIAFAELLNLPGNAWVAAAWLVVFLAAGTGFVRQELRHQDPVIQLRLFSRPGFAIPAVGILLANFAMYGTLLTLPLLLAHRPGWPVIATGVMLAVMMGAIALISPASGWLADHMGKTTPAVVGFVLTTAGMAALAIAGPGLSAVGMGTALAVTGIGVGLTGPSLQTISLLSVVRGESGMASGLTSTSRYLGSITCSALLAGPFAASTLNRAGFTAPFTTYAAAALAGALLVALLPKLRPSTKTGMNT